MKLCILFRKLFSKKKKKVCFPSRLIQCVSPTEDSPCADRYVVGEKCSCCNSVSLEVFIYDQQLANACKMPCKNWQGGYSPAPFQCLLLEAFSIPVALIKSTESSE